MASRIPGWLPLELSAVPLPPEGPLPGLHVQVALKIPANSEIQLQLPVVVGPVGYQSPVRIRCRFDARGRVSHLSYDDPFSGSNDSEEMESDNGDVKVKTEPVDRDEDDAKMESDNGNVQVKTEPVDNNEDDAKTKSDGNAAKVKTEPIDNNEDGFKMEPAEAKVEVKREPFDIITLD